MADYFTPARGNLALFEIWARSSQTDFVDEDPSDGLEVVTCDGDRFELVQDFGNHSFYHWEGNYGKILSPSFELQGPPQGIVALDDDGDGDLDLFISDAFGAAYISINVGAEIFARQPDQPIEAGPTSRQDLLERLPPDMRARIQILLERGFNSCEPLYTDDRDLQDQKRTTLNCFGTAFWVLSGNAAPGDYEHGLPGRVLIRKLAALGYHNRGSFRAFEEGKNAEAVRVPAETAQNLTTGDVLVFKSPPRWDTFFAIPPLGLLENCHAALYLGNLDGDHVIFHKPDCSCGPVSPYEITTLQELFREDIAQSLYKITDVYRR